MNENRSNIIGFYHEYEEYGCFSNWYPADFDYAGRHYAHCEQYMMAQKVLMFQNYDLASQIMATNDPAECKKLGTQKFRGFNAEVWEKTCYRVVLRAVKAKFSQHSDILKILLGTGSAILAECSAKDKKWGIGVDINDPARYNVAGWHGKNLLGRILMEVREQLGQEVRQAQTFSLKYEDASDASDISEWTMTAGALKKIPQYYNAVHAYSDTLDDLMVREAFYSQCSLSEWDTAMRINMGGGLPLIGFYEMKQDVYDTARRLNGIFS